MNYRRLRSRGPSTTALGQTTRWVMLALMTGAVGITVWGVTVARAQQPAAVTPLVFDGVTVIDVVQGQHLSAQRVVIVGNHIQAMGAASKVSLPKGARIVDARGKYLIPGLWDMHVHAMRYPDFFYPLFLANGITGIRDAGSQVPLDTLRLWQRQILAGTLVGPPRQFLAGPAVDESTECMANAYNPHHICVSDSASARHLVDSLHAAGADFIKTYSLGRAMYFVIAAEARRVGMEFGGHLNVVGALTQSVAALQPPTVIEASDSGATFIDHPNASGELGAFCFAEDVTVDKCKPMAERFLRNKTWWVPTLTIVAQLPGQTGLVGFSRDKLGPHAHAISERFHTRARAFWNGKPLSGNWLRDSAHMELPGVSPDSNGSLRVMEQVGFPIVAGTDVAPGVTAGLPMMEELPPGFTLHAELALYVANGLTPLHALQTATINPAKAIHRTDSLGTVAPGKLADLVLLDADPLVDITNTTTIRAVVANGRYFDRAALDSLFADIQDRGKHQPKPLGSLQWRP